MFSLDQLSRPIHVALWTATAPAGGVAKTQFAATFVVTAVGPELRTVERCKQAPATRLPGDSGQGIVSAGRAARIVDLY